MIAIGALRHRVEFLRPATTRDRYGQVNADQIYTAYASRWAALQPQTSTEVLTGNKPEGQTTFKVTMRHLADVQLSDRIQLGERVFEISGIRNIDERNIWHELTAIELVRPVVS